MDYTFLNSTQTIKMNEVNFPGMPMELCDCGGLCGWNSYFQRWNCNKCEASRTEDDQKIVREYIKLKYK